ncbi:sporulation protein [Methanogenium sp. S4BF]|uniref:GerW family sporulation protein n=1 Tax=Methanogenium sp. S4BF TaxID=1789226 RepID=UPI002417554F|nr:spore germination protein GerW family protein [Methanogenium sp. S4BF]WFN34200.1 sporulation protein [Methanogenium sp. S4BF]
MSGEDFFKLATDELDSLINANTIMGDAIDAGDKVIIPIASFGFGFGGGMLKGAGKDPAKGEGNGEGAGAGAGGGVSPVALIILHKKLTGIESVQVISLKKHTAISEAIATIGENVLPQVTETLKAMTKKKEPEQPMPSEPAAEVPEETDTA